MTQSGTFWILPLTSGQCRPMWLHSNPNGSFKNK